MKPDLIISVFKDYSESQCSDRSFCLYSNFTQNILVDIIGCYTIDNRISKEDYAMDTGTTACVVLVTPNVIICCNAGDSRGVLMKNNNAVELSFDHKP